MPTPTIDILKEIAKSLDDVSSVERKVTLYYEVLSPHKITRWQREAGPFKTVADARQHLATLDGVVAYSIVEDTVITRVIEEQR